MKMPLAAALMLVMTLASAPFVRAEDAPSEELEYYTRLAKERLAASKAAMQAALAPVASHADALNAFAITPHYFRSEDDGDRGDGIGSSRADGAGVQAAYTRKISEFFSLGVIYNYAFANVDVRDGNDFRWESHTVALAPEFDLAAAGRLSLSLAHAFDKARGHDADGRAERTSLMSSWEKDFAIACAGWTLTPYAGWRSMHSDTKDGGEVLTRNRDDDAFWMHTASAGAKLGYRFGSVGLTFRGGVSHRFGGGGENNNGSLFGDRMVAPNVMQFSHAANRDRTVGTAGAELEYLINNCATLGIGYAGMFGKNTRTHAGALKLGLFF